MGGTIKAIEPDSVAASAGLEPGDEVLAINSHLLMDVIDAQFYGADDVLTIQFVRAGQTHEVVAQRAFGQSLGIEFEHPTFDIDIRRCNNLCPFCFVLQNAPRMRRTLYIKDDDYRYSFLFGHYVTLTNLNEHDWARIAEQRLTPLYVSVHATDLETRRACLRNPKAPDILGQLRWLADRGIQTHTQLVVTPDLNDGALLDQSVHELAALYPAVLSATVGPVGLTKHHKYHRRPHAPAEAKAMVKTVQAWQKAFKAKLGVRFVYLTDEWYLVGGMPLPKLTAYDGLELQSNGMGMVRDFLDEWERVKRAELGGEETTDDGRRTTDSRRPSSVVRRRSKANAKVHTSQIMVAPFVPVYQSATLATATLFAPTLQETVAEFSSLKNLRLNVMPIVNNKLGESITVAGLLAGEDVIQQLLDSQSLAQPLGELVILPRLMFDHPDSVALDDVSPSDVARALNRPVALADWMGDVVDALAGRNRLMFYPMPVQDGLAGLMSEGEREIPVVREGGWAVEKYL